jgi:hypothetical protein
MSQEFQNLIEERDARQPCSQTHGSGLMTHDAGWSRHDAAFAARRLRLRRAEFRRVAVAKAIATTFLESPEGARSIRGSRPWGGP